MILKEKILFSKEECESIISYNDTYITNWLMGDRKYNSQPINYSLETNWLFDKLKDFVETETNIEIRTIKKQYIFINLQRVIGSENTMMLEIIDYMLWEFY